MVLQEYECRYTRIGDDQKDYFEFKYVAAINMADAICIAESEYGEPEQVTIMKNKIAVKSWYCPNLTFEMLRNGLK